MLGGGYRRWEEDAAEAIGGLKKEMKKDTGEKMIEGYIVDCNKNGRRKQKGSS